MAEQAGRRFGAWRVDDGVHFALWAPLRDRVDLVLYREPGEVRHRLDPLGDGWHALTASEAAVGDRYQFLLEDLRIPDPASRAQADGVHGPSVVVDPQWPGWRHTDWKGRPWHESVIYELHVGTFSAAGTFDGVREKLPYLVDLGVTAIQLMPLAQTPGTRNWGYDGVLPFAPHNAYGAPDSLKALVDAAHGHGLMMFLDVVYNHFGPEGNYLASYAPFFRHDLYTGWGDAIDFRQRTVRDFFIQNALQWLDEYRFDGLRLDAVHAIRDEGAVHFLAELAETVRARFDGERHVHLVLENERNEATRLGPGGYAAQWNDDWHNAAHVLLTGERDGYYAAYADAPIERLVRSLAEGFNYQGEPSPIHDGRPRGEPSSGLPPTAFVDFLQNHDQVGNRALGERLGMLCAPEALDALTTILLLSPHIPLLFMGEEWRATSPFLFFTDFHDELAAAVRDGRRREFAKFPAFAEPEDRAAIPDPNAWSTFAASRLDWTEAIPARLDPVRSLLAKRREVVVPLLPQIGGHAGEATRVGAHGLDAKWRLTDGRCLRMLANLGPGSVDLTWPAEARVIHQHPTTVHESPMPPWSVAVLLQAQP